MNKELIQTYQFIGGCGKEGVESQFSLIRPIVPSPMKIGDSNFKSSSVPLF